MNARRATLAAALFLMTALTPRPAPAQAGQYDVNWAPMHSSGQVPRVAFTGAALFGHDASLGDSIRKCYGHDTTQGGRYQSQGRYEDSYFMWPQAFASQNATQGLDIGFVSIQAATSSDLRRDVCISPFGQSPDNNGGHNIGAFGGVFGLQPQTAGSPFPTFWQLAFSWVGTSVGNVNWIGVQANHPFQHPLLVNVIFEVQGRSTEVTFNTMSAARSRRPDSARVRAPAPAASRMATRCSAPPSTAARRTRPMPSPTPG